MKLRNKKTGEIGDIAQTSADCIIVYYPIVDGVATNPQKRAIYNSLAELNDEWEDYEESKEKYNYYYLDCDGGIYCYCDTLEKTKGYREIGNYFDTEEEAEKAVEKLKAWTRLRGKGFKFTSWNWYRRECGFTADEDKFFKANGEVMTREAYEDLDLLFEGEE